jgi:hypothetical protein
MCSSKFIMIFRSNAGVHIVGGFYIVPGQVLSMVLVHPGDRVDPSTHIDQTNTQLFIAMCYTEFIMMFCSNAGVHIVAGLSIDPGQVLSMVLVHSGDRVDPSTHVDQTNGHLFTAMCSSKFIMMFQSNAAVHIVAGFSIVPGQVSSMLPVHPGDRLDPSTHIVQTNTQLFTAMSSSKFITMFQSNAGVHTAAGFSIVSGQVLSVVPIHPGDRVDPSIHVDRTKSHLFTAMCSSEFIPMFQSNARVHMVAGFSVVTGQV